MVVLLNSLVNRSHRTLKVQCFGHLQAHYLDLDLKMKKLEKHFKFTTRHKILKAWLGHIRARFRQRELEAFEKQKQREVIMEKQADDLRFRAQALSLIKMLKKNVHLAHAERQIEEEHEARKQQIDEFFNNLRNKATREKEMEEHQKQIERNKEELKKQLAMVEPSEDQSCVDESIQITPFKEFTEKLEEKNRMMLLIDEQDLFEEKNAGRVEVNQMEESDDSVN